MSDSLFDVFGETPNEDFELPPEALEESENEKSVVKNSGTKRSNGDDAEQLQNSDISSSKKVKMGITLIEDKKNKSVVIPVVADAFEREASREVEASAGLGNTQTVQLESDGKVKLRHQVRHQVALPPNYDYKPIGDHVRTNEARTYPFTLDPFQDTAISCIDRMESVLVSAHTSAGKTVVAEYAIAQSLREKQRVIYTSPIKASFVKSKI